MSETGTVVDRRAACVVCGAAIDGHASVCAMCTREAATLLAPVPAPKATRKRRVVEPLTDAEIARELGMADHVADYKANGWKSGLRQSPQDRPTPRLGAGRITGKTAVPSHRLIDAVADRGQDHTRVPGEIVRAIGKLAYEITHAGTAVPRKCAELSLMLGEVGRSGCVSNSKLRRTLAQAADALALAAARG